MNWTLITCTGDRPEAFALCEKYVKRQTATYKQWIVLDDGDKETECTMGQQYIYCPQFRGRNSLVDKLYHAFTKNLVKGDAVAFIEDDDWYSPIYLGTMEHALHDIYMAGEGDAIYYNVLNRWWFAHHNMRHASLCQTVIRREAFPHLVLSLQDKCPFIDVRLWKAVSSRCVYPPMMNARLVIGIKAMPGRAGYGTGHGSKLQGTPDPSMIRLKQLIGEEDAKVYEQYHRKSP